MCVYNETVNEEEKSGINCLSLLAVSLIIVQLLNEVDCADKLTTPGCAKTLTAIIRCQQFERNETIRGQLLLLPELILIPVEILNSKNV